VVGERKYKGILNPISEKKLMYTMTTIVERNVMIKFKGDEM
jgi:hypothetical protein